MSAHKQIHQPRSHAPERCSTHGQSPYPRQHAQPPTSPRAGAGWTSHFIWLCPKWARDVSLPSRLMPHDSRLVRVRTRTTNWRAPEHHPALARWQREYRYRFRRMDRAARRFPHRTSCPSPATTAFDLARRPTSLPRRTWRPTTQKTVTTQRLPSIQPPLPACDYPASGRTIRRVGPVYPRLERSIPFTR